MGPRIQLAELTHILVDYKKKDRIDNEMYSEASEPSKGLKYTQYELTEKTIHDMYSVIKQAKKNKK